jgi:hypothetical protein
MIKIWQSENLFFSKSGEFGPIFFMENPLYRSKSYFSGRNFGRKKQNIACQSACELCSLTPSELTFSLLSSYFTSRTWGKRSAYIGLGKWHVCPRVCCQHSARKHSLRTIITSANMVTSLLTPLKSQNSNPDIKKLPTKTIKAQHSTLCTNVSFFNFGN